MMRAAFHVFGFLSTAALCLAVVLVSRISLAAQGALMTPEKAAELARGDGTAAWAVYLLAGILTVGLAGLGYLARAALRRFDRYDRNMRTSLAALAEVVTRTQQMAVAAFLTAKASNGELNREARTFMERIDVVMKEQREVIQRIARGGAEDL